MMVEETRARKGLEKAAEKLTGETRATQQRLADVSAKLEVLCACVCVCVCVCVHREEGCRCVRACMNVCVQGATHRVGAPTGTSKSHGLAQCETGDTHTHIHTQEALAEIERVQTHSSGLEKELGPATTHFKAEEDRNVELRTKVENLQDEVRVWICVCACAAKLEFEKRLMTERVRQEEKERDEMSRTKDKP